MKHDILMITHRRPDFTRLSLARLLDTCDETMKVWVWHNGNDAATLAIVRELSSHRHFHTLHVSDENRALRTPTNWFWNESTADFLSKVDDDCLMPYGWGERLRAAHIAAPQIGLNACWHYYTDDIVDEFEHLKLRKVGDTHLYVHGFVQGSGYVMKRKVYDDLGPIRQSESFSTYGLRAAVRGWLNGWHHPLCFMDHMDDPRSPHYPFKSEEQFRHSPSLSKEAFGIRSLSDAIAFSRHQARRLQLEIIEPRNHFGIRGILRKLRQRLPQREATEQPKNAY